MLCPPYYSLMNIRSPSFLTFASQAACITGILCTMIYGVLCYNRLATEYMSVQDRLSTCSTTLIHTQHDQVKLYQQLLTEKHASNIAEIHHSELSGLTVKSLQKSIRQRGWAMPLVYIGDTKDPIFETEWPSQCGQDRTIYHLFRGKQDGYFVDLAANHAVIISNTVELEQNHGWDGICIEANPQYFDLLYQRRCQVIQAAVGHDDNELVQFNFIKGGEGGVIGDAFDNKEADTQENIRKTLVTVSVEHLFQDLSVPAIIDYMSLDIEGAEEWVFENFPWNKYTFLSITIERPKSKLKKLLTVNGYSHICNHGGFGDQLWLHSTFPDIDAAIASLNLGQAHDENGNVLCRGNWIHSNF